MTDNLIMKNFRILGWLEALSLLLLMFLAMPLKYVFGMPQYVFVTGNIHGGLFVIYCLAAFAMAYKFKWSIKILFYCLVLACLPFGTIYFDYKFCR